MGCIREGDKYTVPKETGCRLGLAVDPFGHQGSQLHPFSAEGPPAACSRLGMDGVIHPVMDLDLDTFTV